MGTQEAVEELSQLRTEGHRQHRENHEGDVDGQKRNSAAPRTSVPIAAEADNRADE